MEIKNFADTNLEIIVDCLTKSFENYFVKMPSEVDFWRQRFHAARVDYSLSFGAFDEGELVAFIIHGIDSHNDKMTAFNTGTGVIDGYRGQKLVDKMYEYTLPILKQYGIEKCMLEVIDENNIAIRVYERIGFEKDRYLRCFKGDQNEMKIGLQVEEIRIEELNNTIGQYQKFYAWDSTLDTIIRGGKNFTPFSVKDKSGTELGYFIINSKNNSLIQIEAYKDEFWSHLIAATKDHLSPLRINNVDNNRVDLVNALLGAGLQNHINQFEMLMPI